MGPGVSAAAERDRSLLQAEAHDRAARRARKRAAGFGVAADTEPETARALESLQPHGYTLLHDRAWPGATNANLDHLAVGPGGVLVVDTKAWRGTVRVGGGVLYRDDDPQEGTVEGARDQALAVEAVLHEVGLAPLEVVPVLCFVRHGHVEERIGRVRLLSLAGLQRFAIQRGKRLDAGAVQRLVQALDAACPPVNGRRLPAPPITPPVVAPRPAATGGSQERLFSDEDLALEAVIAAQRQPIEEWMTFLHPEQLQLVRRSYSGPCRIRGAVGTGKTVVGLHRAAYLAASHPGRILFTTFVKTLPPVLRELYRRLAPDTVEQIEFTGLHRWAKDLLDAHGVRAAGDPWKTRRIFDRTYTGWAGRKELASRQTPREYWRDEVDAVIKGRGLTAFEQYADLRRVGRRTRLSVEQRALVWDLYVAYEQALREADVCDANDILAMALRCVEEHPPQPGYRAVIADEVQDLNLLGVRLLHALVGDAPDGLTLIGDGQQAIYPGGFNLAEAGVSVAGRGAVLRVNYRNTRAVLDYASVLVADDDFDDLTAEPERGRRDVEVLRHGAEPVEVRAPSVAEHDRMLVEAIRCAEAEGSALGDMAVLATTRSLVKHYLEALPAAGVAVQSLERYDGTRREAVKVGTIKRAKGLEFARVFLPQVTLPAGNGAGAAPADPADAERGERERREYFVAMTRARDALWLGHRPPRTP